MEQTKRLTVSGAPHIFSRRRPPFCAGVIVALTPAIAAGIWFFCWNAARVLLISVASCVIFEFLWELLLKSDHRKQTSPPWSPAYCWD